MNIGNHIHTANNKKAYRKPVLEVVDVDRDIVLMGSTDTVPAPFVQSNPESTDDTEKTNSQPPSKSTNPFGGGTPEYER